MFQRITSPFEVAHTRSPVMRWARTRSTCALGCAAPTAAARELARRCCEQGGLGSVVVRPVSTCRRRAQSELVADRRRPEARSTDAAASDTCSSHPHGQRTAPPPPCRPGRLPAAARPGRAGPASDLGHREVSRWTCDSSPKPPRAGPRHAVRRTRPRATALPTRRAPPGCDRATNRSLEAERRPKRTVTSAVGPACSPCQSCPPPGWPRRYS